MCESCCTPILPQRAPMVSQGPAEWLVVPSSSKLQHQGYRCGAPRQCCRRMAPAHLPGAYTVYALITQTLLGCLPPSNIQLHLPRKPTALHVPGISLPSGFVVRRFFSRRIKIMFWHISGTSCGGAT